MTYSGVPKAGAPGPHVDVRGERAVDHRRAGPDDLRQRDEEERLGILLGERAGQRDRAHRAGERERRGHDRLAVQGHLHQAVAHRAVEAERRVRVDDGHQGGFAEEVVARHPADEAGDLEGVVDRARAEPEALPGLVELDRECPVHVEVAGLDRQVVRFERAAALLVDDVEGADEPDVVDEVGEVAGPPAAIEVARRRPDRRRPRRRGSSRRIGCSARGSGRGGRIRTVRSRPAPRRGRDRAGRGGSIGRRSRRRRRTRRAPGRRAPRPRSRPAPAATPDGSPRPGPPTGSRPAGTGWSAAARGAAADRARRAAAGDAGRRASRVRRVPDSSTNGCYGA